MIDESFERIPARILAKEWFEREMEGNIGV